MKEKSRAEKRDGLFTELGMLVAPLRAFAYAVGDVSNQRPHIRAQYDSEKAEFYHKVRMFATVAGVTYEEELNMVRVGLDGFWLRTDDGIFHGIDENNRSERIDRFEAALMRTQVAIRGIPCQIPDFIVQQNSPFLAYLKIRAMIQGASTRLELFDPYLDSDVYHRYLADVSPSVQISLVADDAVMLTNDNRKKQMRDRVVAVSELFAAERPNGYRLLSASSLHDRHLRIDNSIWHLGGSLKDAAKNDPYTLTSLGRTSTNHNMLDAQINVAAEWYGPTTTAHRKT